jgi:hypothetical protein
LERFGKCSFWDNADKQRKVKVYNLYFDFRRSNLAVLWSNRRSPFGLFRFGVGDMKWQKPRV